MDFFERQNAARRKTVFLGFLFTLAVAGIAFLASRVLVPIGILLYLLIDRAGKGSTAARLTPADMAHAAYYGYWIAAALTVAVIGIAAFRRWLELRRGGEAVAALLGGRKVSFDTTDTGEQRFRNIVEEMAIASGVPVPEAYIIDQESSINAFAAGYSSEDSVVAVTRGAIEQLDRDELQGVIAHEFSHILNGDARINLRLLVFLTGLMGIHVLGRIIWDFSYYKKRGRKGGGFFPFWGMALVLSVGGYLGVFFGKLIRAAISRQREFLADAAAVQFTRNPRGLAGALKKVLASGSAPIHDPHAQEVSHMFFADAVKKSFFGWWRTHPPLEDRIQAIEPGVSVQAATETPQEEGMGVVSSLAPRRGIGPRALVSSIGAPTAAHLKHAQKLHSLIPEEILQSARAPRTSKGVVYGLLLDEASGPNRESQLFSLKAAERPEQLMTALLIEDFLKKIPARGELRLPLLEICLTSLRRLDASERSHFLALTRKITEADGRLSVFEFSMSALLESQLNPSRDRASGADKARFRSLEPVLPAVRVLLSLLSFAGGRRPEEAEVGFSAGARSLNSPGMKALGFRDFQIDVIRGSFARMRGLTPELKERVVGAFAECVLADGKVRTEEIEILRAFTATMGCPMPPSVA